MITHGVLANMQVFDWLTQQFIKLSLDIEPKPISWKETPVFDNSNRAQAIYKERWR